MSVDGDRDKDLRELNHRLRGESKRVEDGVLSEDDFKVNGNAENIKDRHEGALRAPPAALQISQQQQSQGAMVCWERFLHLRSLKVLLVENDDSTRHVVTALLRNCSYEVTEAANGFQAWKILEDLTNHIDLVLTEVVMPGISGIGLLCKIMSHKTRKNVPIIMMSSHDSMGLVFKCLSKGAVDFLVKPVRKNELKNLWQHVWRRCHSKAYRDKYTSLLHFLDHPLETSSGSGSESGTQSQKSVKSKSMEMSDNDTGSNNDEDNGSIGLNVGDGSDNGSGTQSSWTKQAVEIDSPRPVSPRDQVAECPDSTCAQVIHSNAEGLGNKQIPVITKKEHEEHEERLDNVKDLEKVLPGNLDLQLKHPVEDPIKLIGMKQKILLERVSSKCKEQTDKGHIDLNSETPSSKLNCEVPNLTGFTANTPDLHMHSTVIEASNRQSMISDMKNKAFNDSKETSSFELSLKRLRGAKDVGTAVLEDRNVLRRSDSSAFSRYNASSNANKAAGENNKSGSPRDSSIEKTRKGSVCELQSHSNGDHSNQCSNVGSNNIDMGSTTNHTFTESAVLKNNSTVSSSVKYLHPPSSFQPSKGDLLCASQQILPEKADDIAGKTVLAQPRDIFQERLCQPLAHNYEHHLSHNMQQQQLPPNHDDSSLKKMAATVLHCGSSNVLGGPIEGNCGNYSVSGIASGSNHGSSTVVNAGGINVESDNGIAGKSGSGSGDGSGSGSGDGNRVDQNMFSQREAALTKFRQKRKERCFRKKVRYQSRKRLAEQRPRVRGQFVRQTASESTSGATDS